MINFCGVVHKAFKEIWTDRKTVEFRARKKRDAVLDKVAPEETLVIFERGSMRYITAKVTGINICQDADGVEYAIEFDVTKKLENCPYKHYQGFYRFDNYDSIKRA